MPSSSSDESIDSSRARKKHKKGEKMSREEKSSSKADSEKKKKSKKEDDSKSHRHHHKSTERKHEKKSSSKKRRSSSSDSDSDAAPETKKRNASPEPKRSLHKDKPPKIEVKDANAKSTVESKHRHSDRSEKDNRTNTGPTASGGRQWSPDRRNDGYRNKLPQPSHKRFPQDDDDGRERSDKRTEDRQQYGPSDRPKGNYYNRDNKTPPWKRRNDQDDEGERKRPAWATSRVIEHAEQIQKRKLLWQRPSAAPATTSPDSSEDAAPSGKAAAASSSSSAPSTNWANMLAATGSDEKSVDKFKRLMGIRDGGGGATAASSDAVEAERNRQQALYRDLDQQYNIARSVTHTGRGKGLGFF